MDPNIITALIGAGGGLVSGSFKAPLQSMNDLWYATVGFRTDLLRQKAEENNRLAIEEYAKNIANEISEIPEENVKEPDYSIAGPALEASTYFVNNENLRKMFAKLVASSMDDRLKDKTRTAFVEFVKQMNSLDAQLLTIFSSNTTLPIAEIHYKLSSPYTGYNTAFTEVLPLMENISNNDRPLIPSALVNLRRLGLVAYDYNEYSVDYDYENNFSKTPEYISASNQIQVALQSITAIKELDKFPQLQDSQETLEFKNQLPALSKIGESTVDIAKGQCRLTELGKNFISVCL